MIKENLMSYQDWFNILVSIVGALSTWWLVTVWQRLKDSELNTSNLKDKYHALELLIAQEYVKKSEVDSINKELFLKLGKIEKLEMTVATHYVTKEDFKSSVEALIAKLDKIDEKLDRKADK
jgi:hypothetical protein